MSLLWSNVLVSWSACATATNRRACPAAQGYLVSTPYGMASGERLVAARTFLDARAEQQPDADDDGNRSQYGDRRADAHGRAVEQQRHPGADHRERRADGDEPAAAAREPAFLSSCHARSVSRRGRTTRLIFGSALAGPRSRATRSP